MKKLTFALLSLASFSLAHAGVFNLTEPQVKWDKKEISVCFAEYKHYKKTQFETMFGKLDKKEFSIYTPEQRQIIQTQINKEYTQERAGISFSGWEDCSQTPESDVYLFRLSSAIAQLNFRGFSSVGQSSTEVERRNSEDKMEEYFVKQEGVKKSFIAINTRKFKGEVLPSNQELELTSTHEFGHTAGLRHEHADKYKKDDANCLTMRTSSKETVHASTDKVSVYDPNSVMNYCFMDVLKGYGQKITVSQDDQRFNFQDKTIISSKEVETGTEYTLKIGLSLGDIHALKCLYSYNKETKNKICLPTYNPRLAE